MADVLVYFRAKLKTFGRQALPAPESIGLRYAVMRGIQLYGIELFGVMLYIIAGLGLFGINGAPEILVRPKYATYICFRAAGFIAA